jgi:hypothetical protein
VSSELTNAAIDASRRGANVNFYLTTSRCALLAYRYDRTDPETPPALEYSSVTVRGTCPMLGGVLMLACFEQA